MERVGHQMDAPGETRRRSGMADEGEQADQKRGCAKLQQPRFGRQHQQAEA